MVLRNKLWINVPRHHAFDQVTLPRNATLCIFYADASLANHWHCFPGIFEAIPGIIPGSADFTDADLHNNPIVQHCWRVQVGISVQPLSSLPFLPVLSSFVPFILPSM